MKDLLTTSCIAGTIAFLYKNIFNHILYYSGVTSFLYRMEAATMVLPLGKADSLYGSVIGLFADLVLVAWVTLVIAYLIRVTGPDFALLKGAFVGASSWLVCYGFVAHTGILGLYKPQGINSGLITIFFDVTVGIVSAYVLVLLNRSKIR